MCIRDRLFVFLDSELSDILVLTKDCLILLFSLETSSESIPSKWISSHKFGWLLFLILLSDPFNLACRLSIWSRLLDVAKSFKLSLCSWEILHKFVGLFVTFVTTRSLNIDAIPCKIAIGSFPLFIRLLQTFRIDFGSLAVSYTHLTLPTNREV